eukprot:CAMPEP_0172497946 /NCGR_PEP_ID=MMETSP1066-20121228/107393_1 /TAXON_ID=671091 /ORGANISM="Coscinodiscus wailesii, Strain CCMP2513" /LENGTH=231 /DNA_ID=CAMNT_0013270993 /DNA_START=47 /DNA_END=742 /DNA_ORIENTATION=+
MSLRFLSKAFQRQNLLYPGTSKKIFSTAAKTFSTASDKTHFIVNALGADRVGIVPDISKIVANAGGNVGESHAATVGSYFSITMLLSVPSANASHLKKEITSMDGLSVNTLEMDSNPNAFDKQQDIGYSGRFLLEGVDDLGLVYKITSILARHALSIETMETSEHIGPYGGTTLFTIDSIVTASKPLPKSFNIDEIRKELVEAGDKLNCDVSLEDNVKRKDRPNWIRENCA